MGFRIMQLKYKMDNDEANIEQGILLMRPYYQRKVNFGIIESVSKPYEYDLNVVNIHEYEIKELGDGYKKIMINVPWMVRVENEDAILLMMQNVQNIRISEGVQKIAGRYYYEGIFLLKPNNKIAVTRGSLTEEFVALQFENKMYLVKVYTD